jgi:hypothetical protein
VKGISCFGRAATGVLVQKVDVRAGDSISTVSIVPKEDADQYDITEEVKEVDDAILIE